MGKFSMILNINFILYELSYVYAIHPISSPSYSHLRDMHIEEFSIEKPSSFRSAFCVYFERPYRDKDLARRSQNKSILNSKDINEQRCGRT